MTPIISRDLEIVILELEYFNHLINIVKEARQRDPFTIHVTFFVISRDCHATFFSFHDYDHFRLLDSWSKKPKSWFMHHKITVIKNKQVQSGNPKHTCFFRINNKCFLLRIKIFLVLSSERTPPYTFKAGSKIFRRGNYSFNLISSWIYCILFNTEYGTANPESGTANLEYGIRN